MRTVRGAECESVVNVANVVNSELINEQSRANSNYSKLKTTAYLTNFSPVPK